MLRHLRIFLFILGMTLDVAPLQAHPQQTLLSAQASNPQVFASEFHHSFAGADHLLAMVAVGILSVQVGRRALRFGPQSFFIP